MEVKDIRTDVSNGHTADEPINVWRYWEVLWRKRITIIVVAIVSGAISVGVNWRRPVYLATARLQVATAPGATLSADAIARYRGLLDSGSIAVDVVSKGPLAAPPQRLTAADLRAGTSLRTGTPANTLFLDTRLPDPELATQAARESARRLVDVVSAQDAAAFDAVLENQRIEMSEADKLLTEARQALTDFRKQNADLLTPQAANRRSDDLADTLAEIPAARARLRAAEKQLADTKVVETESLTPARTFASQQVATFRAQLAGLEAKRDYLSVLGSTSRGPFGDSAAFDTQANLVADIARAQRVRGRLVEIASQLRRDRVKAKPSLQFTEDSVTPGTLIGNRTSSAILRGVAVGTMLAIAGVLFHYFLSVAAPSSRGASYS